MGFVVYASSSVPFFPLSLSIHISLDWIYMRLVKWMLNVLFFSVSWQQQSSQKCEVWQFCLLKKMIISMGSNYTSGHLSYGQNDWLTWKIWHELVTLNDLIAKMWPVYECPTINWKWRREPFCWNVTISSRSFRNLWRFTVEQINL